MYATMPSPDSLLSFCTA